jgi:hypothetical protein
VSAVLSEVTAAALELGGALVAAGSALSIGGGATCGSGWSGNEFTAAECGFEQAPNAHATLAMLTPLRAPDETQPMSVMVAKIRSQQAKNKPAPRH